MDEDFKEVGDDCVETASVPPYWPPDEAMRLECLRLAVGGITAPADERLECLRLAVGGITAPADENLAKAKKYYAFVKGSAE